MRKILVVALLFLLGSGLYSQDLILTKAGELLIVKIVKVESSITFYKVKGKQEMTPIYNSDIEFFNWNSRSALSSRNNIYNKKDKIVTSDASGNTVVLQRQYPKAAKYISFVAVAGIGLCALGAYRTNDMYEALGYVVIGTMFFIVAAASGVVHLALKAWRGKKYKIERNNDLGFNPFVPVGSNQLPNINTNEAYLSFAKQGLGLQLNF